MSGWLETSISCSCLNSYTLDDSLYYVSVRKLYYALAMISSSYFCISISRYLKLKIWGNLTSFFWFIVIFIESSPLATWELALGLLLFLRFLYFSSASRILCLATYLDGPAFGLIMVLENAYDFLLTRLMRGGLVLYSVSATSSNLTPLNLEFVEATMILEVSNGRSSSIELIGLGDE